MLSVREIDEANAKFKVMGMEPFFISPNGGKVTVEIETPDGKPFQAESECSERDNFQRKIGTAIAFGRAVQVKELVGQSDVNAPYPVGAAVRNLSRGVLGTVVGNRSRMVGEETVFDYVIEDANRVCDLVGEDRVEAA
jgi:hypothetical protein